MLLIRIWRGSGRNFTDWRWFSSSFLSTFSIRSNYFQIFRIRIIQLKIRLSRKCSIEFESLEDCETYWRPATPTLLICIFLLKKIKFKHTEYKNSLFEVLVNMVNQFKGFRWKRTTIFYVFILNLLLIFRFYFLPFVCFFEIFSSDMWVGTNNQRTGRGYSPVGANTWRLERT